MGDETLLKAFCDEFDRYCRQDKHRTVIEAFAPIVQDRTGKQLQQGLKVGFSISTLALERAKRDEAFGNHLLRYILEDEFELQLLAQGPWACSGDPSSRCKEPVCMFQMGACSFFNHQPSPFFPFHGCIPCCENDSCQLVGQRRIYELMNSKEMKKFFKTRGFCKPSKAERQRCRYCDKYEQSPKEFAQCSRCKLAFYCSRECQVKDWKDGHKKLCHPFEPSWH